VSQQINLFNPIFRKQKKYFSSVTMLQALGIICLGCALLVADAANRKRALKVQAAATDATLAAKQQRLNEVRVQYAPRAKSTTLGPELAAAQTELTQLTNAAETIKRGGFGDTRGFSDYFRAFARQSIDGLWLTELNIASGGASIGVQGNTLNAELVPQYMQRLAQEPVMKGATFSTLAIGAPAARPAATEGVAANAPAKVNYLQFSLQSSADPAPVTASASAPVVAK
jgi:hypothetical protein